MANNEGTPLHGDRAAWNTTEHAAEHARDIDDNALLRHLPAPSAAGTYARDNGTNWVAQLGLLLADLTGYVRGAIIRGGAAAWEALTIGAATTVLKSDGTDVAWGNVAHSELTGVGASDHHDPVTLDANADAVLSLSTQEVGLDVQGANEVFAGPASGVAAVPTFRPLTSDDLPSHSHTEIDITDLDHTDVNAIHDDDFSATEGFMRKTGAGAYEAIKSNLSAAVSPTVDEDSGDGYAVGSIWIDTTANKQYICLDATVGAAIWIETTQTGDGGGTPDASDVTYTPTTTADWDGGADPGNANDALDQLAERITDIESAGPPVTRQTILTFSGELEVADNPMRVYNRLGAAQTISEVFICVGTAPAGANIIVDVHKDGATIFTNQAHRPEIAASASSGSTTDIDVATWAAGEYLTAHIDQVGSGTPGSDLVVHIVHS